MLVCVTRIVLLSGSVSGRAEAKDHSSSSPVVVGWVEGGLDDGVLAWDVRLAKGSVVGLDDGAFGGVAMLFGAIVVLNRPELKAE